MGIWWSGWRIWIWRWRVVGGMRRWGCSEVWLGLGGGGGLERVGLNSLVGFAVYWAVWQWVGMVHQKGRGPCRQEAEKRRWLSRVARFENVIGSVYMSFAGLRGCGLEWCTIKKWKICTRSTKAYRPRHPKTYYKFPIPAITPSPP